MAQREDSYNELLDLLEESRKYLGGTIEMLERARRLATNQANVPAHVSGQLGAYTIPDAPSAHGAHVPPTRQHQRAHGGARGGPRAHQRCNFASEPQRSPRRAAARVHLMKWKRVALFLLGVILVQLLCIHRPQPRGARRYEGPFPGS